MYNKEVLEVFLNSSYAGHLKGATVSSTLKSKEFGDVVKFYLKINDYQKIEEMSFKAFGGVPITYTASKVCELFSGISVLQAQKITEDSILKATINLPRGYDYVANLCYLTVADALDKYFKKMQREEY